MLLFICLLKDSWSTFKFTYTPHEETPKEYSCTCFWDLMWKCFINVCEKLNFYLCSHENYTEKGHYGFFISFQIWKWTTRPLPSWVPSPIHKSLSRCSLDCTPWFLLVSDDSIASELGGDESVFTSSPKNLLGPVLHGGWGSRSGQKHYLVVFMELWI